jgi:hypothetical protein
MMERFLERISLSDYKENMILKGGFLITAMVGIAGYLSMSSRFGGITNGG